MAANIKLKRSAVSGRQPTDSDLQYGELALNYADGILYYKSNLNEINSISGGGATTDSAAPTSTLRDGDLWWDAAKGQLKIYYDDGDPTSPTPTTVAATTNANTTNADYYFDTFTDRATTHAADAQDPNITIYVGDTIQIDNTLNNANHPFYFVTQLDPITNGYNSTYNVVNPPSSYGGGTVSVSYQFNSVGTYYYVCGSHAQMNGRIDVIDPAVASAQWVVASPSGKGFTGSAGAIYQGDTAPPNPANGQIWYNSETGKSYIYYTNPATTVSQFILMSDPTVTDGDTGYTGSFGYTGSRGTISPRALSVIDPQSGDTRSFFYTDVALTVSEIRSVIVNGSSVEYEIVYASTKDAGSPTVIAGETTTNVTVGSVPTITTSVIPANNWVWLNLVAVTGSVTEFTTNMKFSL